MQKVIICLMVINNYQIYQLRKEVFAMTKISKNAAKEFKDKLCVCYSKDDPDTALIITKEDAANHKEDMDEHINNQARLSNIYMAEALDIINARTSDAYDKFESKFSKLIKIGSSCYVHAAGIKRPAETKEKQYIERNAGQRTPFFIGMQNPRLCRG